MARHAPTAAIDRQIKLIPVSLDGFCADFGDVVHKRSAFIDLKGGIEGVALIGVAHFDFDGRKLEDRLLFRGLFEERVLRHPAFVGLDDLLHQGDDVFLGLFAEVGLAIVDANRIGEQVGAKLIGLLVQDGVFRNTHQSTAVDRGDLMGLLGAIFRPGEQGFAIGPMEVQGEVLLVEISGEILDGLRIINDDDGGDFVSEDGRKIGFEGEGLHIAFHLL